MDTKLNVFLTSMGKEVYDEIVAGTGSTNIAVIQSGLTTFNVAVDGNYNDIADRAIKSRTSKYLTVAYVQHGLNMYLKEIGSEGHCVPITPWR